MRGKGNGGFGDVSHVDLERLGNPDLPGNGDATSLGQASRPRTYPINLANIPLEGAQANGAQIAARGKVLIVNPDSAISGVIVLAIDEGESTLRLRRCAKVALKYPFAKLAVFRASSSQAAGMVYLDVTWDEAEVTHAPDSVTIGNQPGAPLWNVQVSDPLAVGGGTILAARATRWEADIHNEGPGDIWVSYGSPAAPATSFLLVAGDRKPIKTTAAVYAIPTASLAPKVTATEVYST